MTKIGTLTLRFAEDTDAEAIAALINAAFKVELFFKLEDRTNPAEVLHYLESGRFLLAEEEAGLAACLYLEMGANRCYLGLLSVDPKRQKTGLGGRMMAAAEEAAREAGCSHVDIRVVNLRTELFPIYQRLGYVEEGTEPWPAEKPTRVPCHFIRMSKALDGTQKPA